MTSLSTRACNGLFNCALRVLYPYERSDYEEAAVLKLSTNKRWARSHMRELALVRNVGRATIEEVSLWCGARRLRTCPRCKGRGRV